MKTIIKIGSRKLTIQVAIALFLILAVILLAQESEDVTPTEEATTEEADATAVSDTTTGDELPPARKTSGTGIAAINAAYEAGTEALSKDDTQAAISHFQKAAESADNFLKGIVNPSEEAQAKYFRGLALYYWGKLDENSDRLEQASTAFGEAINAFKNIEKLGRFYLDSKYRQGMCSYRQYQLTRVESEKIRKLGEAYGDFRDFIEDPALESVREEMAAEIERAQYLAALCLFERGAVKLYQSSEYKSAKEDLTTSASYFAELENAQDQHIAVLAKLMEGECHYYLARLYMQIRPDEWDERKLSNQRRDEVISSELSTAEDRIQAAKKAMGTFTAVEPYITYSLFANRIARGATGDLSELRQVMEDLANQSPTGMWSNEKEMRAADTQLLRYFAGQAASGAAVGGWQRLVSDFPIANYWMGWINYIEAIEQSNKYPQASTQFTNFLGRVGGSTRESMMKADAKFRDAECTFWNATLKELAPALQDAKASYKSLTSSQGAYLRYLPEHIAAQAQVRIQIIEVQERMAAGTSDINRVITNLQLSGLDLPKDAKAYLNFGRYFLEKANREAAQKRLLDIGLALGLFGHVAGTGSVASGEKNEAKFLQGVAYIKKATAVESSAEANEAMSEAKNILNGVGSPLDVESKYAIGIGYFNIEDRSNAQSALSGLKDKYVRPAFVYGMASGNCVTKGTYMRKVIASTERASTWYLKAQQAFDALDCAANVPPQSGGLRNIGSPITYESLADPKAQMDELRAEGLLMWQKISEGKKIFPMDDLIPDMPPKTTITIKFIIKGTDGKAVTGAHTLIIDGEPELAEKVSGNIYKATLSRANHDIIVELKGYYRFAETMSITEERDVELIIKKAVRYVKASNLTESKQPMAVTSSGDQIIVASNSKRMIFRRDAGGNLIAAIDYEDIEVSAVTGLAVDGDYLLVVDGRGGQIKLVTTDGSDVKPIAVKGETYGGAALVKPSAAIAVEGRYYIVDTGNRRVVVFEGVNYRSKFGEKELEHPMGIAYRASDNRFLVTDIVLGKVFVYTPTGEMVEAVELPNVRSPGSIYINPDGFILVADYVTGEVYKFTNRLELIGPVSSDVTAPIGMSQIGSGPDATLYIAGRNAVAIFKGAWDNAYMPSK